LLSTSDCLCVYSSVYLSNAWIVTKLNNLLLLSSEVACHTDICPKNYGENENPGTKARTNSDSPPNGNEEDWVHSLPERICPGIELSKTSWAGTRYRCAGRTHLFRYSAEICELQQEEKCSEADRTYRSSNRTKVFAHNGSIRVNRMYVTTQNIYVHFSLQHTLLSIIWRRPTNMYFL